MKVSGTNIVSLKGRGECTKPLNDHSHSGSNGDLARIGNQYDSFMVFSLTVEQ